MVIVVLTVYLIGGVLLCDWWHERKTRKR